MGYFDIPVDHVYCQVIRTKFYPGVTDLLSLNDQKVFFSDFVMMVYPLHSSL